MSADDSRKSRLEAARAVADGDTPVAPENAPDNGYYDNLNEIARLARAFSAIGESARDDEPSFTWGHLEVRRQIGRGGFGRVYRAFDTVLQRDVALKLRDADSHAAAGMTSRAYIEEARRLARVRHPNVLAVHGADLRDNRVGIWTDLLEGETLRSMLEREGRLAPSRVLDIGLDLARALEAVHARGLVHGDVKPANIMLEPDGRTILMDFGAGGAESGHARFGTPATMAPEALRGGGLSGSGDVYALGAVLYRMLTGAYPGGSDDPDALAKSRQAFSFPRVGQVRRDIPKSLSRLIDRLLSPEPATRPGAGRVATEIEHILREPARRRRRMAVAAVIGSLAIGILVAGAGYFQAKRAESRAQEARTRAESINRLLLGMMEQTAPLKSPGGMISARRLLDAGRQRLGKLTYLDAADRANLLVTLADLYEDFELAEEAAELSAEALDAARRVHGIGSEEARRAARIRAGVLLFQGEHDEAMALLDATAARVNGDTEGARLERARILRQRAVVATRLERFDQARSDLDEARALVGSLADPPPLLVVSILQDLSFLAHYEGEYEPAQRLLEEAIALLEDSELPNERFHLAGLFKARARLARDADGDLATQESLQRKALAIYRELYDRPTKTVATSEYEVGASLYQQEKHAEALPFFQRAIEIYREGGHLEGEATAALMIAKSRMALGDLPEAREYLSITERNYRKVYGDSHSYVAMMLNERARLELDEGNPVRAEALARQSLSIYRESMGDDHPVTGTAHQTLGRALFAQSKLAEAEREIRRTLTPWLERFGEDDWRVAGASYWLGRVQLARGDLDTAKRHLDRAHRFYRAHPDRHPGRRSEIQRLLEKIRQR